MQKIASILNCCVQIKGRCSSFEESWGYISFEGLCTPEFFALIATLETDFDAHGITPLITITLDKEVVPLAEVKDYNTAGAVNTWKINLNKEPLIGAGVQQNFFVEANNFEAYINSVNVLDQSCVFSTTDELFVLINDLELSFGGPMMHFLSPKNINLIAKTDSDLELPTDHEVQEQVYFVTSFNICIQLRKYQLTYGDFSSTLSKAVLHASAKVFASTIANEFYSDQKIVIDGLKRIELVLGTHQDSSYSFMKSLYQVVSWLYAERVQTRKKLFSDRLTLELLQADTLLSALHKHLDNAFAQAKERYEFVILDRRDAYTKELKDLLKDLRTQSDLYATKIRGVVTNLLRDAIAGIILVGFTLFTRISDAMLLDKSHLISYVFNGLGIYYLISLGIQVAVDIVDVSVTEGELKYWKNATKEYIPDTEFNNHRQDSLRSRRKSFKVFYVVIGVFYVVVAIACFKYPEMLRSITLPNSSAGK